jgi:hypothetical protein
VYGLLFACGVVVNIGYPIPGFHPGLLTFNPFGVVCPEFSGSLHLFFFSLVHTPDSPVSPAF